MDTVQFWLLHVATAVVGLVAFVILKFTLSGMLTVPEEAQAAAPAT